jgi:hypothetical protein
MPRGRFAVNQCGRLIVSHNDITTLETVTLSTGETYFAGISAQNYAPGNLHIGPNNLHGGQPYLTGTDTEGVNTYPVLSQWNSFHKQVTIEPYPSQRLPNDVGVGAFLAHGGDPDHPGQLKEWDGTGYWSALGGYGTGIAQFFPYPQSVAYIIGASWSAGVATFTIDTAFAPATGQYCAVKGITPTGWNCSGQATHIDSTHFSMAIASNPGAYAPAATPGNNGVLFQILPGGAASEGLMIYDPVKQTPLQLTPVGWRDVTRNIVMDFASDADYTWDQKVLVDFLCSSPVTANRAVTLPPMTAIYPLALGYSRTLRIVNTAPSLGTPYYVTVSINSTDIGTGYIGYFSTSVVLYPGDAITVHPDGRGWGVSSVFRASSNIAVAQFTPQLTAPSGFGGGTGEGWEWFDGLTDLKLKYSPDGLYAYSVCSLGNIAHGATGAEGGAQFVPLSADPTGVGTGYVYYNSTSNVLRFWNGAAWKNVALAVAGGLTVPNGGTGLATVPANAILIGNGTGSLLLIDPSTWASPSPPNEYPALVWTGTTWAYLPVYSQGYIDALQASIQVGSGHPAGGPISPATVPTTAPTQTTPWGATTAAQFNDMTAALNSLLAQVELIRAALVAADIMS